MDAWQFHTHSLSEAVCSSPVVFASREIARGSFGVVYQGAFRGTEVR
jgi:hypothetical protein